LFVQPKHRQNAALLIALVAPGQIPGQG
jgi:hypothetical protein